MAGDKQHYIPQAILKAFRLNPESKTPQVHVFRPDRTYPSAITGVAAQRFFFSEPVTDGSQTLDDVMTRHENGPLNDDLIALASLPPGPVDCELASRVLGHLSVRNHHLRGVIQSGASSIADLVEQLFGGHEQISRWLGAEGPRPGPRFRAMFAQAISGNTLFASLGLPEPVLEFVAYMMLRENQQAGFLEVTNTVSYIAAALREQAPDLARESHVKSLNASLVPEGRTDMLRRLDWRIVEVGAPTFILPDFLGLAFDHDGDAGTIFTFDQDSLSAVSMPLSPTRMLIGEIKPRAWDLSSFNAEAVPHCLEFFVSAFRSEALDALAPIIGSRALEPIQGGLADAAREFRAQIDAPQEIRPVAETGLWRDIPARPVELYTDFLDTNDADRLVAVFQKLIALAHNRFDISPLLRIVAAADYGQALASLDRGSLAEREPIVPSTEGWSAAYNIPIEQNGEFGIAMVLHADIIRMLLSEDDILFSAGASVVLAQLAKIGADKLLGTVFAKGITVGEAHDRWLLGPATTSWKSYLIAGYQCMFSTELGGFYRNQFLERLATFKERLIEARRNYRVEKNVDALLHTVIGEAAGLLNAAATAAASLARAPDDTDVSEFKVQLEIAGWARWFELLQADLADIWNEGEAYPDQEAFLVLDGHLQRLLLTGAIFLWDDGSSFCRVEVPHWSDWDWMLAQAATTS